MTNSDIIKNRVGECVELMTQMMSSDRFLRDVSDVSDAIVECIVRGKKLLICGNGGSATDASHFAGEVVGRFKLERKAWPAIALSSDIATLTSVANDYGYNEVFARQVEGFAQEGDIFFGISTSGNSENVYKGFLKAKERGIKTIALVGKDGGKIAKVADYAVVIPSEVTARIQEAHILVIHILCEIVEKKVAFFNAV